VNETSHSTFTVTFTAVSEERPLRWRHPTERSEMTTVPHLLVLAAGDVDADALAGALREAGGDRLDARVLLVVPALNGRLRSWTNDDGRALATAADLARALVHELARAGVAAAATVGDASPAQAAADALALFPADAVVVAGLQPEPIAARTRLPLVAVRAHSELSAPSHAPLSTQRFPGVVVGRRELAR
jgi:hypothetical protein